MPLQPHAFLPHHACMLARHSGECQLQELEAFNTKCRSIKGKHYYSAYLDWQDDLSTIMAADDPIRLDRLRRKHMRAQSASLQRQQAAAAACRSGRRPVAARPMSAPAVTVPHSESASLAAALSGAVVAATRPVVAPRSQGFQSALVDEYLRSQCLVHTGAGSASRSSAQTSCARASDGVLEGDPGFTGMPDIAEGVEDVGDDDGMDGERLPRGSASIRPGR
eukprot:352550-Chlamydomonas_euryale.AAC.4